MFGSLRRLSEKSVCVPLNNVNVSAFIPLNACQDSCNIVCGRPSVLQDVQTQLSRCIHIRMKHLADELDCRRLVWILFLEVHDESEGSVFEGSVGRSNDDSVPLESTLTNLPQGILSFSLGGLLTMS